MPCADPRRDPQPRLHPTVLCRRGTFQEDDAGGPARTEHLSGLLRWLHEQEAEGGQIRTEEVHRNAALFKQRLDFKDCKSASSRLAVVCNRVFSVLESRGILRTGVKEVFLASLYNPQDPLAAEFIRTCRHQFFYGHSFLQRLERLAKQLALIEALPHEKRALPKSSFSAAPA